MEIKIEEMAMSTGIPVIKIKKALKLSLLPEVKINNTDRALSLLEKFKGIEYFEKEIIDQWEKLALEEVKKELCFYEIKNIYNKLPENFEAKKLALDKLNKILINQANTVSDVCELKELLRCSKEHWPSYLVIEKKLQSVLDGLIKKAKTITEMKKIYSTCDNLLKNKQELLNKWNDLVLAELIKASNFNDFIYIYENSDSKLDSFPDILKFLKVVSIEELNNPKNNVFDLQNLLDSLPLNYELEPLFEKKIYFLIKEELRQVNDFLEIKKMREKFNNFTFSLDVINERVETISENILKKGGTLIELMDIWNYSSNEEVKELAIINMAKFYKV